MAEANVINLSFEKDSSYATPALRISSNQPDEITLKAVVRALESEGIEVIRNNLDAVVLFESADNLRPVAKVLQGEIRGKDNKTIGYLGNLPRNLIEGAQKFLASQRETQKS